MDAILRELYATAEWSVLLGRLKRTRQAVKCRAQNLGLSRPRNIHQWTADQVSHLQAHFATESAVAMAQRWGVNPCVVYRKAQQLGLEKDPNFLSDLAKATDLPGRGAATGFKKGNVPWSKGRKMRPEVYAIAKHTMFKKGQRPANQMRIGDTRVNADGYLDRKISATSNGPRDWEAVHRLVWKEHHGPIPKGKVVCFKPGRRTTVEAEITIDVLECITMRERMLRNSIHNLPEELKRTIQAKTTLKSMITKRKKKNEQAQHR